MSATARGAVAAVTALLLAAGVPAQALAAGSASDAAQPPIGERVAAALRRIDPADLDRIVRTLAGFGTRHVLSRTDSATEGAGAARAFLQAEFAAMAAECGGRLQVEVQTAEVPCVRPGLPRQVTIRNVVATLRGSTDPERIYVVGGHYDSRNARPEDGVGNAPGAVDDASGTAVALAACRALCTQQWPATLVFVAYDGEELGLLGSGAHAAAFAAAGAQVDGMLGCDVVGNTLGMDGKRYDRHVRCFSYAATGNDSNGRSLARAVTYAAATHVPGFGVDLILRGDRYGRGGDHRSFFERGYPAVRLTEPREDFSRQHADVVPRDGRPYGDLPEFADPTFMANVAKVVTATLAELAAAPLPPLVRSAQLRRDRYDTEVIYTPAPGTDPQAVEFVWRPTSAADWTGAIAASAAQVRELQTGRWQGTLAGVCLDDCVVGVRAVGSDGSRSRVAVPPEPDRLDQAQQRGAGSRR